MTVSRFPTPRTHEPELDLQTVRETLLYMHHDFEGARGMEAVARALKTAIDEIESAQAQTTRSRSPVSDRPDDSLVPYAARFIPRSAHR